MASNANNHPKMKGGFDDPNTTERLNETQKIRSGESNQHPRNPLSRRIPDTLLLTSPEPVFWSDINSSPNYAAARLGANSGYTLSTTVRPTLSGLRLPAPAPLPQQDSAVMDPLARINIELQNSLEDTDSEDDNTDESTEDSDSDADDVVESIESYTYVDVADEVNGSFWCACLVGEDHWCRSIYAGLDEESDDSEEGENEGCEENEDNEENEESEEE